MALNTAVFRTRAISAIFFVAIMLTGLLWNHWSFLVLFSIIHFGCWWEYLNLQQAYHGVQYSWFERLGLMLMGYALMLAACGPMYQINHYSLAGNTVLPLSAAGMALYAYGILRSKQPVHWKSVGAAFAGLLYISTSWAIMIWLRQQGTEGFFGDLGWVVPMLIVSAIWINDTMAYIVGSMIGKTPLSKWSPKKTWEGTIGGVLLAAVVVVLIAMWILRNDWQMNIPAFVTFGITAAVVAATGTMGDLLESWLKRRAGVKDSGHMMPGHGGFLDRFDSMLIATTVVGVGFWLGRLLGMDL